MRDTKKRGWVNDLQPHSAQFSCEAVLPWKGRLAVLIGRPVVAIVTVESSRHPGTVKAGVAFGVKRYGPAPEPESAAKQIEAESAV